MLSIKTFAKQSCGLTNKEYETILEECKIAIVNTKEEIDSFKTNDKMILDFLKDLKECWFEDIKN